MLEDDLVAKMLLDALYRYGRVKFEPEDVDEMGVPFLVDFASRTSYPREDLNWAIWTRGGVKIP